MYLVTGGSGGLGRIVVKEILARAKDARVVVVGRSQREEIWQELRSVSRRSEASWSTAAVDVSDAQACAGCGRDRGALRRAQRSDPRSRSDRRQLHRQEDGAAAEGGTGTEGRGRIEPGPCDGGPGAGLVCAVLLRRRRCWGTPGRRTMRWRMRFWTALRTVVRSRWREANGEGGRSRLAGRCGQRAG